MKLLSVALSAHDSNFTYFDGNKVSYYKPERKKQLKRYYSLDWHKDIKGLDYDAMVMDFQLVPPDCGQGNRGNLSTIYNYFIHNKIYDICSSSTKEQLNKLFSGELNYIKAPQDICDALKAHDLWIIGHYYAHSLSGWMLHRSPDVSIVIDGMGDRDRSYRIYRGDTVIEDGSIEDSIGNHYMLMGEHHKILGHPLDIAGKLMAHQSYDNINEDILRELRSYNTIRDICQTKYFDYPATVHLRIQEYLLYLFAKHASEEETIMYTGGVAQNVLWNTAIRKRFSNIIIPPHSADEGLSLGGIELLRRIYKLQPFEINGFPYVQSDESAELPSEETIMHAANLLAEGKTVGWYQGNGEIGPRALGNRSILMDPRIKNGKDIINRIKKRENYRPFGASVLKEHSLEYFDTDIDDYMLYTAQVKKYLPAVTHIDNTCRIQVVDNNTIFKKLLQEFYKMTGCPVLLNTSLNLAGRPICGQASDAIELYSKSSLDALIVGNRKWRRT
jgi:carbamoyltransferase